MEPSVSSKRRLWFALFVVALIFSLLIGRLAYIQIVKGEEYKKLAMLQQTRNVPIPAKRGVIYDRKGIKLAFSVQSLQFGPIRKILEPSLWERWQVNLLRS